MRIASVGHAVFAATMIALGVLGLTKGDYVSVWQPIPQSLSALSYLCAVISLICGLGLLWQRTAAAAARLLLAWLLLWLLVLRLPGIVLSPTVDYWWAACKIAVMAAATWVLYVWFAAGWDKRRFGFASGDRGLRIARMLYGVALIPFGVAHFLYLQPTAALGAWLAALACGLGIFHRRRLHRSGHRGAHRGVRTAGCGAGRVRDRNVHAAGVGTHRGGRYQRRLPMERDRCLGSADRRGLGSGGILPRRAVAGCGQAFSG